MNKSHKKHQQQLKRARKKLASKKRKQAVRLKIKNEKSAVVEEKEFKRSVAHSVKAVTDSKPEFDKSAWGVKND
jgi:hypothetical protein